MVENVEADRISDRIFSITGFSRHTSFLVIFTLVMMDNVDLSIVS